MKAMVIVPGEEGGTLDLREIPDPPLGEGQLRIGVRAAALNRADLSQRAGRYRRDTDTDTAEGPRIAGLEAAGEVTELGPGVEGFEVGDRVMAMCTAGFAEQLVVDARLPLPVPDRLSWAEAAAAPTAFITEHDALVTNARLRPGESVLVTAAASGVGNVGVQIASLLGANPVLGTIASDRQVEALTPLGLDLGIDHRRPDVVQAVLDATDGRGVDVVIDHVGGPILADNLRSMALQGRLVSVGRLAGKVGELDLDYLALRRLRLIGVTFRTRTMEEWGEVVRSAAHDLLPALGDGRLRPLVDRVFPLEDVLAAQAYMESGEQIGKIVLTLP